jgi:hypothetical protein
MSSEGSLIKIHFHDNYDILKELSEVDGNLYYKGNPILSGPSSGDEFVQSYTEEEIEQAIVDLWAELGEKVEFEDGGKIVGEYFVTNEYMEQYVQEALTKLVAHAIGEDIYKEESPEEPSIEELPENKEPEIENPEIEPPEGEIPDDEEIPDVETPEEEVPDEITPDEEPGGDTSDAGES